MQKHLKSSSGFPCRFLSPDQNQRRPGKTNVQIVMKIQFNETSPSQFIILICQIKYSSGFQAQVISHWPEVEL